MVASLSDAVCDVLVHFDITNVDTFVVVYCSEPSETIHLGH